MEVASENKTILLIDADSSARARIRDLLSTAGYGVSAHPDLDSAVSHGAQHQADAVLLYLDWAKHQASECIDDCRRRVPGAPLILLTTPEFVEAAVRSLRHGVEDYLLRPPDPHELRTRLERILEHRELDSRVAYFQEELSKKASEKHLEARSAGMRVVVDRIHRVAPRRSTVLIYGESGVGKELVARSIHFNSPRRNRPFIAVNCAAMPASLIESELFGHERGSFTGAHARARGKFEIAHRGTLFLDEIGDMDRNTQAKLLRVLEEREFMRLGGERSIRVDVRVIAATNADLEGLVADSRFRRDLYYRLKVVTINVPPLRERREDMPQLVHSFLLELSRVNGVRPKAITPEAMAALQGHDWPGNVRELKNLLESILVSMPGDAIGPEDLPQTFGTPSAKAVSTEFAPGTTLSHAERELIRQTLEHTGGNRTHSAALLGIGVRTLQRKIHTYDIRIAPRRRRSRSQRGNDAT